MFFSFIKGILFQRNAWVGTVDENYFIVYMHFSTTESPYIIQRVMSAKPRKTI